VIGIYTAVHMSDDEDQLDHIPGDNGPPIINNTFRYLSDPWAFDEAIARRFGPVARMRLLGRTIISTTSTELIGEVLVDRERSYSSTHGWGHFLAELFPRGLMLRDFDDHARHRKILKAAFTRQAREGYHALINRATAETFDVWAQQPTLKFYPAIKRALLNQATRVFLGLDPEQHGDLLLRCFTRLVRSSVAVVRLRIPGTTFQRGRRARRELAAFLRAEIPNRRGRDGEDLFSRLCNARDEDTAGGFDDDEIVDHMIFLLFAAHDTTTSALTTMLDELTAAPELLERASNECRALERLAARDPELGPHALAWPQLEQLVYVERCFREALRVNPPVPYIMRRTVRPCRLGGHELPARAPVTVRVSGALKDPACWTDPERFDPDRFTPEHGEDRRHRHAWIPFGSGAHRCIGADLALQQAKVFCHQLFRRFDIERVSSPPTAWRRVPLPTPIDGLPLRLRSR
jgi:cytochrome P450